MRKTIITSLNDRRITAEEDNGRITSLFLEDLEACSLIGRIYVGRVKHIIKNIRSAFVDIGEDMVCYYPLEEWERYPSVGMAGRPLHEGDEILVQVEKDAVKTKAPSVTTKLTFTGQYLVLMTGKTGISFSAKIKDRERKEALKALLCPSGGENTGFGMIVRTNGENASEQALLLEKERLEAQMNVILSTWTSRTGGSLLHEPEPAFLSEIFNNRLSSLDEVVTDDPQVYDIVRKKAESIRMADENSRLPFLRYYEDAYPLTKLYSLETVLERARKERVWLKSGGYLVIQPTEALVSIDVNTGKFDGKKSLEETFFKINLEAAEEIAVQLRLRNLSGIIIVDFIDMTKKEHKEALLKAFEEALRKDPVKTVLLGLTRLNLAELTRKKVRKPLHEIWPGASGEK
ncbi:ribonuclease E/G [Qiania dongpingensis]|uniref:Ribonuclease E/G n=1 Tax=Qiania dongpingensis TaxID=2763669 RepID=A0A7G9G4Q5_9FIRM|nr:ribonuclease E/G [Qiania dongpingensis]QNM05787.1 ribonuclease E/G [Qiania dongpingensis]